MTSLTSAIPLFKLLRDALSLDAAPPPEKEITIIDLDDTWVVPTEEIFGPPVVPDVIMPPIEVTPLIDPFVWEPFWEDPDYQPNIWWIDEV